MRKNDLRNRNLSTILFKEDDERFSNHASVIEINQNQQDEVSTDDNQVDNNEQI